MTVNPAGRPGAVRNPLATYTSPLVEAEVAQLLAASNAIEDHRVVRRAAAAACCGNWDLLVGLLTELHAHPETALGVARAALADLVECAIVASKGNGERAAEYFEVLLEAQLNKDEGAA